MTTQKTYNKIKELYPQTYAWIADQLKEFERLYLIDGREDLTKEQIILFATNVGFDRGSATIADKHEYIDEFDDIIYKALVNIGIIKGVSFREYSSGELLEDIRESILKITNNYGLDISPPEKEYNLGNKVELYYDGVPSKATIVDVGFGQHGLLIDGKYCIAYVEDSDTPTNYIIELQKRINIE
jgi:hypothetical protein